MSNESNWSLLAKDSAPVRQQQCHDVTRLLKEYTGVMYDMLHQIIACLEAGRDGRKELLPWSVMAANKRYRAIWKEMGSVALFASQMLVHYQLDEADTAELRLRLVDAENSISSVGDLLDVLPEENREFLGPPIPRSELSTLSTRVQQALKNTN
jgi:hypothetical protein